MRCFVGSLLQFGFRVYSPRRTNSSIAWPHNSPFHLKNIVKEQGASEQKLPAWRIYRGYYMAFSLSVEKYFTSEHSKQVKYFSTWEEKFRISKRPCNVLFIILTLMKCQTISLFAVKGTVFYVTIATVIFSGMKIFFFWNQQYLRHQTTTTYTIYNMFSFYKTNNYDTN